MFSRSSADTVIFFPSKARLTEREGGTGGLAASPICAGALVSGGIASVWAHNAMGEKARSRAAAVEIFMLQRVTLRARGVYSFLKPTYTGDLCRSFAMSPPSPRE